MSIFSSPARIDFNPVVTVTAPMTITALNITQAFYYINGMFAFIHINGAGTLGGVMAATPIAVNLPVPVIGATGGIPLVAAALNATATAALARGRVSPSTQLLEIFKTNAAGDVVWVAGVCNFNVSGQYPIA